MLARPQANVICWLRTDHSTGGSLALVVRIGWLPSVALPFDGGRWVQYSWHRRLCRIQDILVWLLLDLSPLLCVFVDPGQISEDRMRKGDDFERLLVGHWLRANLTILIVVQLRCNRCQWLAIGVLGGLRWRCKRIRDFYHFFVSIGQLVYFSCIFRNAMPIICHRRIQNGITHTLITTRTRFHFHDGFHCWLQEYQFENVGTFSDESDRRTWNGRNVLRRARACYAISNEHICQTPHISRPKSLQLNCTARMAVYNA